MRSLIIISTLVLVSSCSIFRASKEPISGTYTVTCGSCNFDMTGSACELAISIDGKSYYVEGTELHDHGDAHASDGMCTVRREAQVTGQIRKGVFVAESFVLLPSTED